jgi:hypothetical protein
MSELEKLYKINKKIFESQMSLVRLYDIVEQFTKNPSDENLKNMMPLIENVDMSIEALKNSLKTFLEEIAGVEQTEVDVKQTENGFQL